MIRTPVTTEGLPYVLSYVPLAVALLWAANKLWAVERLMQCMLKL